MTNGLPSSRPRAGSSAEAAVEHMQPRDYNRARYGSVRARETIRFVSEAQLRYDCDVSLLAP